MKFQNEGGEFFKVQVPFATVPTSAGNTDAIVVPKHTGRLIGVEISFTDALAAHDSNYATFAIANLNKSSAAMLAATDANTTKATGGTALSAHGKRSLSLHGTLDNLAVSAHDRLRCRVTGTGTLANTLTQGVIILTFKRTR